MPSDSVGPTADGFETYGVTGVALITFIMLAVTNVSVRVQLLVWIFMMRVMMVLASAGSYLVNNTIAKGRYRDAVKMNFEAPLTSLVWLTSIVSVVLTYVLSYLLIPTLGGNSDLWWQLSSVITCGTLTGAIIPEFVKVFTSTHSAHVKEVVTSSREGGPSLNILSGLVAGNFSAYYLGLTIMGLMALAYFVVEMGGLGEMMKAPAIFAFGLVAFGFLGMGPVTIAVDWSRPGHRQRPVGLRALAEIEEIPGIQQELQRDFGFPVNFVVAKELLEENDGAGNTFKATAKPVLIGTAVVGATTMIFAIIMALTQGLTDQTAISKLSILHSPFLLGLITGSTMIYWFTGASIQAVTTGAYRAVEFIKRNIKLEGATKASVEDQPQGRGNLHAGLRPEGDVQHLPRHLLLDAGVRVCRAVLLHRLPHLDCALRPVSRRSSWPTPAAPGTTRRRSSRRSSGIRARRLHDATVVGDTVGDPFKDTTSVALNPIIKFTTLFGLLAVELGVYLTAESGAGLVRGLAALFFIVGMVFVWRSFYAMRM